jgi:glutaminyl-peptide cyclotransferase
MTRSHNLKGTGRPSLRQRRGGGWPSRRAIVALSVGAIAVILLAVGAMVTVARQFPRLAAPDPAPAITAPAADVPAPPTLERLRARVVATYPHDPEAFTQGLLWHEGALWESTGQHGQSELRQVELQSGRVLRRVKLAPDFFAEGLARVGERFFQLTWQEGLALVWDARRLEEVDRFRYRGEGWGLCFDGQRLVMSDGSSTLTFRDPVTFAETGRVEVRMWGRPLDKLNELECVDGQIYANVWTLDVIVRIDPATGLVGARITAPGLLTQEERLGTDVLNGIAYRPETGTFFLTGKYWPKLFEVVFEE